MFRTLFALAFIGGLWGHSASAAVVMLSPGQINGGDTTTTQFSDASLTLTPFIGAAAATFNGNAVRLGIDDAGTNANAFNDPDTDPNNGNEERLAFDFVVNAGLESIVYDFSRADGPGPDDGVIIEGFLSDPNASFSVSNANLFAVYDAAQGRLRLNVPGQLFNGTDVTVSFDPVASNGQSLLLSVTDTTQAGAQLAITGIAYQSNIAAVPEPGSLAGLGLLAIGGAILRRRRGYSV